MGCTTTLRCGCAKNSQEESVWQLGNCQTELLLHFNKCSFCFNVGLLDLLLCLKDHHASQPCSTPLGAARVLCHHPQQTPSCCIIYSLSNMTRWEKNLTFHRRWQPTSTSRFWKGPPLSKGSSNHQSVLLCIGICSVIHQMYKRTCSQTRAHAHTHRHTESIHRHGWVCNVFNCGLSMTSEKKRCVCSVAGSVEICQGIIIRFSFLFPSKTWQVICCFK